MRPILKIALLSIVFCIGGGVIVSSFRTVEHVGENHPFIYDIEPFSCALGLAICLISGVVLFKAIRKYPAEPND